MAQLQSGAVFAGRDRELHELVEALADAADGHGRLILLGGEPGIGKSRLADELAARARERTHQVLWGRGWEDAGAPPFWLWVQALRSLVRSTPADELRQHIGAGAADVAQILPELRDLFPSLPPPPDAPSESARFQLFDSTAAMLRNAARARPLLVVLDDLQSADIPSILFLQFLASQLNDMAILVVGTYRDVELTPEHPLTGAIGELGREPVTRVFTLTGLDSTAVATYIRVTADIVPNDHLVAAVWRATSGNPLFVGEAVRLLATEGRLTEVADLPSLRIAVPPGVRAAIAKRIGRLDDATGRALALGAALGPEFGLEVLRRVGDFGADQVLDLIDDAVEAGLLQPVAGVSGRYRFSHDLVRESLYDELSPGRRVRLHRQIAEVLEDLYAGPNGGHLAELAFHFVQAAQQGDGAAADGDAGRLGRKAVDYARRAGDDAVRSLAFEEAARSYSMALAVLDLDHLADAGTRAETLLALGDVLARAGDLVAARDAFLEAADIARQTGDGPALARAALGFGGRHQWARPGSDTRLISLLQDALVMLGGDDESLRARLLTRVACAWRSSPERRNDSASLSRQAIQIARQLDDPAVLSYVLVGAFWATWWPDNPDDRHRIAIELLDRVSTDTDGERIAEAHFLAMLSHSESGRIDEARRELATLTRIITELRQPSQLWIEPDNRAWLALLEGDFGQAHDLLAVEPQSLFRVTPGRDDLSSARMHRFLLARELGRVGDEEAAIRDSVVEFPWYPFHRAALACALLDIDRIREARAVFDDLATDEFRALYRDNEWLLGMSLASEACAALDDRAAAETLYEQLAPFAGRHALGYSDGSVGSVDRYLGLLASTRGRLDDAVDHLTAAIEINDRMGARPWTAHSQHDLAEVMRRRDEPGDAARAAELDASALAMAQALGMALATRIEPPPAVATLPSAPPDGPLAAAVFRRDGEYWTIEFGTDTIRLRDSKGLGHLARLLEAPGQEIHALELSRLGSSPRGALPRTDGIGVVAEAGDGGAVLDAEAKAAYRQRLDDIRADIAQAEQWNDPERLARLQDEERALARELAAALGMGGRDRTFGSPAERARVSVTRAIRTALAHIALQSDGLGEHLSATIRTGTFCSYMPDPRAPITWQRTFAPPVSDQGP